MVPRSIPLLSIALLILLSMVSCDKDAGLGVTVAPENHSSSRIAFAGNALQYADSVFYYKEKTPGYVESPRNTAQGTYGAFPSGLKINQNTGVIDVNNSESGLRYRVWFKPTGSSDSTVSYVTISGVNYRSRVFNISSSDYVAVPFYNGKTNLSTPCVGSGCEFANDNDAGVAAATGGRYRKPAALDIDKVTGAINLRSTIRAGLFGAKPANGATQLIRLYYRLSDKSEKSLNYIDVRLTYYSRMSAVPASLLLKADVKNYATARQATPVISPNIAPASYEAEMVEESRKPRPPDIIIVGQ